MRDTGYPEPRTPEYSSLLSSVFDTKDKPQWVDRGWYVVTEFEKTPSINFQRAVELAKTHPGYTPLMDERNILVYRNIYRKDELLLFHKMYKLIRNWKGAKLYIKGDQIDFDMIGSGVQCYIQTGLKPKNTPHSIDECHTFDQEKLLFLGCIGCHRSHVSMEWSPSQPSEIPIWFAFGKLDHNKVYHINKEELEGAVIGELVEYRYCPLLDLEGIRAFIQKLPDRIDPRKDREWKYNRKPKDQQVIPRFSGGAVKEPDILPVSAEAYQEYLKRKL